MCSYIDLLLYVIGLNDFGGVVVSSFKFDVINYF